MGHFCWPYHVRDIKSTRSKRTRKNIFTIILTKYLITTKNCICHHLFTFFIEINIWLVKRNWAHKFVSLKESSIRINWDWFKCLKPRNATGSNKNLITQILQGIILRVEVHVHVYSYYPIKSINSYSFIFEMLMQFY